MFRRHRNRTLTQVEVSRLWGFYWMAVSDVTGTLKITPDIDEETFAAWMRGNAALCDMVDEFFDGIVWLSELRW